MDKAMADRVARRVVAAETEDVASKNVDEAIDNLVAALTVIQDNLPNIKAENVPEQAGKDAATEILNEALLPYAADFMKTMAVFGE